MLFHAAHLPSVSPTGGSVFQAVRKFVEADDIIEVLDAFQTWKHACIELEKEGASGSSTSGGASPRTSTLSASSPSASASASSSTTNLATSADPKTPFEVYSLLHKHSVRATHNLADFWKCIANRFEESRYACRPSSSSSSGAAATSAESLPGPAPERRALIAGGGPVGLRAAIELALQKFDSVVVLEKRDTFSRLNVMRIHQDDLDELISSFGARACYPKIGIRDRDVISIRRLQLVLTKMALCLGVQIHAGAELIAISPQPSTPYWTADINTLYPEKIDVTFNTLVLATGEKSKLSSEFGFSRTVFRAGNATGITCNFSPSHTPVSSDDLVSGGRVSYLNVKFFKELKAKGLDVENIASYTTEDSHYLVMTPTKATLLERGVAKQDIADPVDLVRPDNVDRDKLLAFAREMATEVGIPADSDFMPMRSSKDGPTWPDVGIFDFTGKTMATEPSKLLAETYTDAETGQSRETSLLVALVGDALVEPFWPTGTGWARGNGSCKLLGDTMRELGPDPARWREKAEVVLKLHEDHYVRLKSESYAPMSRVMGVS
ncbi:[F-actin]-monooxygenase mical2 [Geranomyces variabilis]|nr:[F-actin]-monooxygenase mical2 [Geranomyces variabilis]